MPVVEFCCNNFKRKKRRKLLSGRARFILGAEALLD